MGGSKVAKDVDEYIAAAPAAAATKLRQMRSIFREAAPKAEEGMSYHMPYYRYRGSLGGFAAYKDHVSLFGAIPDKLKKELSDYKTGRGSVQFPLDRPLPTGLVARLVRERVKAKEEGV